MKQAIEDFLEARQKLADLKEAMKEAGRELDEAERAMMDAMVEAGTSSIQAQGMVIYQHRDLTVSGVSVCVEAAKANHQEELLSVNTSKFKSLFNEWLKNNEDTLENKGLLFDKDASSEELMREFSKEFPGYEGVKIGERVSVRARRK